MSRHPLRDRHHVAVDDQHAIVISLDVALDDDDAAPGLLEGALVAPLHLFVAVQVEADPAAMIAVERLGHNREADPAGDRERFVDGADGLAAGDRQPGGSQQRCGELLVGRDVNAES